LTSNLSSLVQGEIPHRGKIIEVGIFGAQFFQFLVGPLLFLNLQFQLDLMHLELVHQPLDFHQGKFFQVWLLGRQQFLGPGPEVVRCDCRRSLLGHGVPLPAPAGVARPGGRV
jgi:hypothetical protein